MALCNKNSHKGWSTKQECTSHPLEEKRNPQNQQRSRAVPATTATMQQRMLCSTLTGRCCLPAPGGLREALSRVPVKAVVVSPQLLLLNLGALVMTDKPRCPWGQQVSQQTSLLAGHLPVMWHFHLPWCV